MPIYAYKCESCGFAKDVLQKMSDTPLVTCPQCGAASFKKQLTAAGFQLKGSGWYVTDFRGGNNGAPATKPAEAQPSTADASGSASDTAAAAPATGPAVSPAPTVPSSAKPSSNHASGSDASSKSS